MFVEGGGGGEGLFSVSIFCVSEELLSLTASNQQICDFYKWVIFEKKRHYGKKILNISELFIQCNTDNCFEHMTSANIYLYECISLLAPGCDVCLCVCVFVFVCVCVISNQATSKSPIMCQTSVDLTSRCVKYTARSFLYLGTKASYV